MADNSVDSTEYVDYSIDTEHYALSSIKKEAIDINAIENAEMADNSVDSSEYVDRSIDSEHYFQGSVDATAIALNAVENAEMADNSVDSAEYTDRSIDSEHYASGSVDDTAIGLDAVGASELGNNSVDTANIVNDAVNSDKIDTKVISGSKGTKNHIADNSIGQLNIGPLAVGTGELIDRAVTQAKIATSVSFPPGDGSVTPAKLSFTTFERGQLIRSGLSSNSVATSVNFEAPTGLTKIDVDFGTSQFTVPRGNHTHPANNQPPSSSIRFKKDIADYQVDGTKLLNLQAKTFKYKAGHRDQQYGDTNNRPWVLGFMAEEVLEAGIEEVVGYDKEGLPASLRYDLLSVYVIDLLKTHQNEIDSLKEEIQRLKEQQ